jgi:hypothetical protein
VADLPPTVARFLSGERLAVAGVSREGDIPANLIFRRLRDEGHEVVPLNPHAETVEGVECYPDLAAVPGPVTGVVVATPPEASVEVARDCVAHHVRDVWFHRSFGQGSVSEEAIRTCRLGGIEPIVGGCPLMFVGKVDMAHACMRWWLQRRGRVPR